MRNHLKSTLSTLAILGLGAAATCAPALASNDPEPGGGGSSYECSAQPKITKHGRTVTVQAFMSCQHAHSTLELDVYITGASNANVEKDDGCVGVPGSDSCGKRWTFTDAPGKQHYSVRMGNSTHWADYGDRPQPGHGCENNGAGGDIACYGAAATL